MNAPRPLSRWLSAERPDSTPVAWSGERLWTLGQLRNDVAAHCAWLQTQKGQRWALCLEEGYRFLVALLATLHAGKTPVLPGHARPSLLEEQRSLFDGILSEGSLNWDGPLRIINTPIREDAQPLPAIPDDAGLELFTSGSTGQPKRIHKSLAALDAESALLAARFAGRLADCRVVSSVSPQHLYGLTFRIFLPMSLGLPLHTDTLAWPEQLAALPPPQRYLFISSPAFLKHLDARLTAPDVAMVITAGGMLHWQDAQHAFRWLNVWPDEIYGSSETGVLAWRQRNAEEIAWQPFPGVTFKAENDDWRVTSPLITEPAGLLLEDTLRFNADNRFHLLGRRGRVVKIAEKRVSLAEVEQRVLALEGVRDAAAILITRGTRQSVGVLLVLDDETRQAWRGASRKQAQAWRQALRPWLEPVALPRFWRVVDVIPVNTMNKRIDAQLQECFHDHDAG
ncbi:acyl-CoA synthetase [Pseudocitrobacter faecalis]|uniref:Acyl-coenzyme A synthetase/AMP-(Fatty) acid ligase n=1 Tax=Pseudocitrobacter faecalis TaxID=1398493 RepID=A0ABX9FZP1_9ENTR|nr:acyl-coenzyme A synthetase/AMP-(fatty) acid ligase [Pseudocitrobacter faecalis]